MTQYINEQEVRVFWRKQNNHPSQCSMGKTDNNFYIDTKKAL